MRLTDERLERLPRMTFLVCCVFYAITFIGGVLGRVLAGQDLHLDVLDAGLAAMTFVFPLVGFLIARRQPRNPIGWLMLAVGMVVAVPLSAYGDYRLVVEPGSLPAADVAAALTEANWAPVVGIIGTYLILLFPDGHLPSPRWRFVGWFAGAAIAYVYILITLQPGKLEGVGDGVENPLGVPLPGDLAAVLVPTIVVLPISFLLCAAALISRFRHSSGVQRLQLKWLATSGVTVACLYLAAMVSSVTRSVGEWSGDDPPWLLVLQTVAVYSFVLIPVSIGIAILKHGLYDIDVVINKAVVFGALAVFITAVYVAIVVGLGSLVGRGDEPNLALSVAATAVVAVAFQPVQQRAQRLANHLVYGDRATPYEVLSDFTDRVGGSYDAAELLPTMARTVAEGVGAARSDVWLATGRGLVRETTWPGAAAERDGLVADGDLDQLEGDRVVPVRHQGELLGAISVTKPPGEPLTPVESKLLDDVAAQAGLVLRNVRLIEDLRSSRERLVTTQDEERRRLERNLHDGAQQRLVAVALMIRTARAQLGADDAGVGPALDQAADQLQNAITELRELARGIHPVILTERGLCPAVTSLAERSPVPVVVECASSGRFPPAVEASLYFAAAEALTNVAKYAHATQVELQVTRDARSVTLEVRDDGIGGADDTQGSGLRGLVDRLAVVGGTVAVHSPPGGGTAVTCTVPISAAPASRASEPSLVGSG